MDAHPDYPCGFRQGGSWDAVARMPASALAPYVRKYNGFEGFIECPLKRLELTRGRVQLVLGIGEPVRMKPADCADGAARYDAFLVGPAQAPLLTEHQGRRACIDIGMPPSVALAVFNLCSDELGAAAVGLQDLLGTGAERLALALASSRSWSERFAVVDSFLGHRLSCARRETCPAIRWAWHRIEASGGRVPVSQLGRHIGWSHRHFVRRFRDQTGLTPKAAARRVRFSRAHETLASNHTLPLGRVAALMGYSDQSHFTREFMEFSGISPVKYRRMVVPESP